MGPQLTLHLNNNACDYTHILCQLSNVIIIIADRREFDFTAQNYNFFGCGYVTGGTGMQKQTI